MSLLHRLSESPVATRLGWTLLHSVWEGAGVALLLAVILAALRRRGPQARYLAACGAMLALVALPATTYSLLPAPQAAVKPSAGVVAQPPASLAGQRSSDPFAASPGGATGRTTEDAPVEVMAATPVAESHAVVEAIPAASSEMRRRSSTAAAWGRRAMDSLRPALPWAVVAWAAGVLALSVWNFGGWVAVQRLKGRAARPVDAGLAAVAAKLARRVGIHRPVRLLQSALVDSPLVIGAFRPVVLLPVSVVTGLPVAQLESILAHELAHVRRHDYLVNLLQSVAETLLFYHPAAWWVSGRIRREREHCCDDAAVGVTRDRTTYVRALAAVAAARPPILAPAAAGGNLLPRVRRLLGVPDPRAAQSPRWLAGAVALGLCLCAVIAVRPPAALGDDPAGAKPAAVEPAARPVTLPAGAGRENPADMVVVVTDTSTGKPIGGASVKVTAYERDKPIPEYKFGVSRPPVPSRTFTADAAGRVTIPLGPIWLNSIHAYVTKDGYARLDAEWRGETDGRHLPATFEAKLEPGRVIGGVVKDEAGKPVEGAEVEALTAFPRDYNYAAGQFTNLRKTVKTDAAGRWRIDGAPADLSNVYVVVTHPELLKAHLGGSQQQAALFAQSIEGVLRKAFVLTGRVTDEKGQAVAGATVISSADEWSNHQEVKADADGRYRVPRLDPDKRTIVLVRHPGRAPVLRQIDPAAAKGGEDFVLAPAHDFAGQAVDTAGRPIPNLLLDVRRIGELRTSVWMRTTTDADGRFHIDGPNEPIFVDLYCEGYLRSSLRRLDVQAEPLRLTIPKALQFAGTVTDAATGQPIKNFRVSPGWGGSRQNVSWSESQAKPGFDGRYTLETDEDRETYAVRVEADGYVPATSPQVAYGLANADKPVTFDAKLVRGGGPAGVAVGPDGTPAAGAEVVLAAPDSQTMLDNGRVGKVQNYRRTTRTDADGRFTFAPVNTTYTVVVLHDAGFAKVAREAFEKSRRVTLQPWARVEGTVRIGARPAANQKMSINDASTFDPAAPRIHARNEVTADAAGRFVFDRVFPGKGSVGRYEELWRDETSSTWSHVVSERYAAEAGQTVRVEVGGTGRPLIGKVILPDPASLPPGWRVKPGDLSTKLTPPAIPYPAGYAAMTQKDKEAWLALWRQTPEGKAIFGEYEKKRDARRYYSFAVKPDGMFRVEDVAPGTYELSVRLESQNNDPSGGYMYVFKHLGSGGIEVTVPPLPGGRSDEPQDVGAVNVTRTKAVAVSQPAPAAR